MAKILFGETRRVGPDGKFRYEYVYKLDCGCFLSFDKRVVLISDVNYMSRAVKDHRCAASSAKLAEKALSYMGVPVVGVDLALGSDSAWLVGWGGSPKRDAEAEWVKQEILGNFKPSTASEQISKNQEYMLKMQPTFPKINVQEVWRALEKVHQTDNVAPPQEAYYPRNPLVNPNARISEGSNFGPIPIFTKAELDEIRKAWRDAEEARFKFDRFQLIELD